MNIPEYSIHATFCQAITCAVCLHNRTKKKLNEKGIKNKRSKPEFFSFFFSYVDHDFYMLRNDKCEFDF